MSQPIDLAISTSTVGQQASALNAALHLPAQAAPVTPPAAAPAPTPYVPPTLQSLAEPDGAPMVQPDLGLAAPGTPAPARGGFLDAAMQLEGTVQAVKDIFATHGFEAQQDYHLPALDSQEWKDTIGDLPVEYWGDLSSAVSPAHLKALVGVAKRDAEAEQTVASYGGAGVAGRIAVAMLDPVSLALGLASGGLGWAAKGTRVVKALKAAGIAGATNAAIEGVLAEAHPGRDGHDVAYAALSGMVLGGTFGYALSRDERILATEAGTRQANVQASREARDLVPYTGPRTVEGTLVDPAGLPGGKGPALLEGGPKRVEGTVSPDAPRYSRATDKASQTTNVEDAVIEKQRTTEEMVASYEEPTIDTFGRDSAGAASQGVGSTSELRPVPDVAVPVAETKFRKVRFDLAATLRGSVQAARNLVGRYVGDSVGAKDGLVTEIGASEHASHMQEKLLSKFYSALTPTYDAWARESGKGVLGRWGRANRREFNTLITRAIRNDGITDPHALKAAAQIRSVFADVLEEAKAAGVKGFENVPSNPNYVPRVFNYKALHGLIGEFGEDGIVSLVGGAMRTNIPVTALDDTALEWVARGYVKRLREVGVGLDSRTTHGISMQDTDYLAALMRAGGATSDQVDEVVGRLTAMQARSDTGAGSVRYGKLRVDLDETFAMQVKGVSGTRSVRIDELFENDIEHLMGRYLRSMSGHTGMAKIGVRSFEDHKKNLDALASIFEGQPEELTKVRDAADLAYKLVTGQPIENLGDAARWSRFMRDYNFTRTMNQAGFAQIPDLAGLFSKAYFRHTLKHLPELGKMMARDGDGKLKDGFARELEALLGVGTDYHNVAVYSMFDDQATGFNGVLGVAEHGLRVMGRGTQAISGMAAITAAAQRLTAKAIVQRFVAHAHGLESIPTERLAGLGIDDAMMGRINNELLAHTQTIAGDSGKKVKALNIGAFTDHEARDALLIAVHKEARRIVQEEDVGDTHKWMHTSLGKLIIQFRRFGIVSYTKQLLNGVSHADAEAGTHAAMSFALAGAAYWAQQHLRMIGMNDTDKRKWEKNHLEGSRVAAAAFARSSFSTLIPAVSDSITSTLLGVKAFDVRTSGQASDLFNGISSVDAANKFARVTSKAFQTAVRDDRQFTERDLDAFRALLPYGNLPPLQWAYEALVKPGLDLPKKQSDSNPDDANWSFN